MSYNSKHHDTSGIRKKVLRLIRIHLPDFDLLSVLVCSIGFCDFPSSEVVYIKEFHRNSVLIPADKGRQQHSRCLTATLY